MAPTNRSSSLMVARATLLVGVAVVAASIATLLPATAHAAQFDARVSGTVTDVDGNPLAGVKITISLVNNRRVDPIPPTELTTDEDGRYFVRNVRAGDSNIAFELPGYQTLVERRELRVGTQSVDVQLEVDEAAVRIEAANVANAEYEAGVAALAAGDHAAAIESLERALTMIEDTAENAEARASVHALIGRAHYDQRDWEAAITHYSDWVRYRPDDPNAHLELASALQQAGRADEAMGHFESALEFDPDDPISLYNIGVQMVNAGAVEDGVAQIERAVAAQPEFPLAHKALGFAYARIEKYQEAVNAFEKYLEQDAEADDAQEIRDFVVALREMIG